MSIKLNEIKEFAASKANSLKNKFLCGVERLSKPHVKYDFDIVESVYADEDSEPIQQSSTKGSINIRLCDIIIALTFILAVFSIFSKNDD